MPPPDQSKLKEKVRRLPESPGVYLMKDRFGSVLYVGKAKRLKHRVSSYFQRSRRHQLQQPKVVAMLDLIYDFDYIEVNSESEALLLEGRLIKEWKPKYNTDFTDDKRFLLVRVDVENPLPRFRLVRFRQSEQSLYFGPFAHAGRLRKTLGELRLKYGILLSDASPTRQEDGTWRLYDDVRAEIYGHENVLTEEDYQERVRAACVFLEGKSREWLADLEDEMRKAAENREFERAAELRDVLFALKGTIERTRKFTRRDVLKPTNTNTEPVLDALAEALKLPHPPKHIECFDISHVSGTFCVASMVHFTDGLPDKANYRRFKIKTFIGNDDFRSMEEVVGRRYRRLHEEGKPFPDLVVIDGGRGQVGAALKAFLMHELEPPPLIGLAKKEETIHFSDAREPLQLPNHSAPRLLLQRIRDEAHRFANTFNAELRRKRMKETVLHEFDGLGPVRREALWERFKNLPRLKQATVDELQLVEGIGPKLAQRLHEFLQKA
ncbi:MAG: excinuclease ABC subunit UvrC [Verrucomicrobiota bacterium JB022]|nr:excinuclease ABC subunit UvrC [Verrucomicrobiota bacterium JB022]